MPSVRQLAGGLIYALASLLLVIGGVGLSLVEGSAPAAATKPITPSASHIATQSSDRAPTMATMISASATSTAANAPATLDAISTPSRIATTVEPTSARHWSCGPYVGWIRGYVVQPGDTLYRIATRHGISVSELQRANCKSGTLIFVGETLWVPFAMPPATQLTIIPTFDTPTQPATATVSPSPTATLTLTQDP